MQLISRLFRSKVKRSEVRKTSSTGVVDVVTDVSSHMKKVTTPRTIKKSCRVPRKNGQKEFITELARSEPFSRWPQSTGTGVRSAPLRRGSHALWHPDRGPPTQVKFEGATGTGIGRRSIVHLN